MTSTATTDVPPSNSTDISLEPILQLASGFMAAKHLFAANELGVFEALADAPGDLAALAARTGLTPRAARISVDAMVAVGLVERDGDRYRNGPEAGRYLAGRPGPDLRPLLRHWDQISYPTWEAFAVALASGPPRQVFELDDAQQAILSAGIEAILAGPAQALGAVVDLSARRRLLDIGGGTGSWTIAVAQRYPQLRATVVDLPAVAQIARGRVAAAQLADRVEVVAGDAMAGELPPGHDAFLVANLVHYWSPDTNIELLRRIRRAAPPDGLLLLADFWTDPTHTRPVEAALMAGEFAVHLRDGDVYSVDEGRGWLEQAGWSFLGHHTLSGPQSVIVAGAA
jgi:SAM-dependent methyltransferase